MGQLVSYPSDFSLVVTIPLENHGELTSRARCVPLQYQLNATRGVKQALNFNTKPSNPNLFVVPTLLQEKETNKATSLLQKEFLSAKQASPTENKMFYELSNKRRLECERYQDCSWFQQDLMKGDICSKLSLAETAEPIIDTNEFDLAMQFANAHAIPWGDEYLEVFDDDILLEKKEKMGEKNKITNPSNDEYIYDNYKPGEDSAYNTYNINFSLRKTDSFDSIKFISSTNPAEILPISYKEKINNSNYGPTMLSDVKSEVKEEVDMNTQDSYVMDSDDCELSIGREEVVEDVKSNECVQEGKNESTNVITADVAMNPAVAEKKSCDVQSNQVKFEKSEYPVLLNKTENGTVTNKQPEPLSLNLDLNKVNFEEAAIVNTPDLDFMDLVEYINEEMQAEHSNSASGNSLNKNSSHVNQHHSQSIQPSKIQAGVGHNHPVQGSAKQKSPLVKDTARNTSETSIPEVKQESTVDFDQISDTSISIAERIKTSAKRRTSRKFTVKDNSVSEEEDEDFSDSHDDDEDYDYREDVTRRRLTPFRKRSKSSASESSCSSKKPREDINEIDSYRERRDKNNEASRRSRKNRKDRERRMFESLEEEERRNVKLKSEAEVLEKQVISLRQLLLQVVIKKGSVT